MEGLTPLYVYWLRAPKLGNVIVYVGCGRDVEARRKDAQRRYKMPLTAARSKPYYDYDAASVRETYEITKHWDTLFNTVRRSTVSNRYAEKCANIGRALTGRVFTPEHRENIAKSRRGKTFRPHSKETRTKIGDGNRGKTLSQSTRDKLRDVNLGKKQSDMTVAKRTAKTRGQKRTPEQCVRLSQARRGTMWSAAMCAAKRVPVEERADYTALLLSGYGHPWRLTNLDEATRGVIG